MSRMSTEQLRSLLAGVLQERSGLGGEGIIKVETGSDLLGQAAVFVWIQVSRDCETGVLRRERLALTEALRSALGARRDYRHPFIYLLTAGEWPNRHALTARRSLAACGATDGLPGGGRVPLALSLRGCAIR